LKTLIRIELERAFKNKMFFVSVFISIAIVIYHLILYVIPMRAITIPYLLKIFETSPLKVDMLPGVYSEWIAMNQNAAREILFVILPLIAAVPYGISLFLDEKNNYINNIAVRTNKRNYYIAKAIVLFLSGGAIAAIPLIVSFLANAVILPFDSPIPYSGAYMVFVTYIFGDVFYSNPLIYIIIYIIWVFVGFGLLNTFCFVAVYIMENRFAVLMAPFIIYFTSYVILNIAGSSITAPWSYLQMNRLKIDDIWQVCIQVGIFIIIIGLAIKIKCSKKKDVL